MRCLIAFPEVKVKGLEESVSPTHPRFGKSLEASDLCADRDSYAFGSRMGVGVASTLHAYDNASNWVGRVEGFGTGNSA